MNSQPGLVFVITKCTYIPQSTIFKGHSKQQRPQGASMATDLLRSWQKMFRRQGYVYEFLAVPALPPCLMVVHHSHRAGTGFGTTQG